MYKKQKGFTLVEMILVTVIIGIVAGIVINVINIPRVQARSRDSKRIGDLKRIQTALELYFADNRQYPSSPTWTPISNMSDILNPYLDQVPADPLVGDAVADNTMKCYDQATRQYYYGSNVSQGKYVLMVAMELQDSAESSKCTDLSNCTGGSGLPCGVPTMSSYSYCYCVQNPM